MKKIFKDFGTFLLTGIAMSLGSKIVTLIIDRAFPKKKKEEEKNDEATEDDPTSSKDSST